MKKLVLASLIGLSSFAYANVNAVVSILPQKTFLKQIGGDKVDIALMVKPGNSPHSYEPKPSQMKDIAKADIYFSIGIEFEKAWLPKFADQNKKMKIVSVAKGIEKIAMEEHSHEDDHHDEHKEHGHDDHHDHDHDKHAKHDEHHDHEEHGHDKHKDHDHHNEHAKHHDHHDHKEHEHDKHKDHDHHDDHAKYNDHKGHKHGGLDPHIWTSPDNVKLIAKNIYKALVKTDKANKEYYKKNLETFISKINNTDKKIKNILKDTPKGTKFMVFHPAWGYFAHQYSLEQIAIEAGGKNPKPKQLAKLIEEAKEEKVKAVFTAPEFSDKAAKVIAKEVNVPVIKVSPLNPKWSQNLQNLAKAIANK